MRDTNQKQNHDRPLLGGWISASSTPDTSRPIGAVVIGYCLEKINSGFQALRKMSKWETELSKTTGKHRMIDPRTGMPSRSAAEREQKKKALESFKQAIKDFQKKEDFGALRKLTENPEMLRALPFAEKGLLFMLFVKRDGNDQNVAVNILASAACVEEFNQLLEFGSGRKRIEQMLQPDVLGRFLSLTEKLAVDPWKPPFQNDLFTNSELVPGGVHAPKAGNVTQTLIQKDYLTAFLKGEISASAVIGLSQPELYKIAERGYKMLEAGKLDVALQIFEALVYLEPGESYFYTALGAIRQQQNDPEGSMYCYQEAIQLQPQNVTALANRGEIFFGQGKLTEALEDFQKVIQLDPKAINASTLRVRFLLTQFNEALNQKEKAS